MPKTSFRTNYKHYKLKLMLFELMNTPIAFMDLMNKVFQPFLDKFVIVFIDGRLVYYKEKEKHVEHLQTTINLARALLICQIL